MRELRSFNGGTYPIPLVEGTTVFSYSPLSDFSECYAVTLLCRVLPDEEGSLIPELAELAPGGGRRMVCNPHANGGILLKNLQMPNFREYAVEIKSPGQEIAEFTRLMEKFLRDIMRLNLKSANFRIVGPDETSSNRLSALFEVTDRTWMAETLAEDDHLSTDGRVMEILSEHTCQGWLEGYRLTGRHGLFSTRLGRSGNIGK